MIYNDKNRRHCHISKKINSDKISVNDIYQYLLFSYLSIYIITDILLLFISFDIYRYILRDFFIVI